MEWGRGNGRVGRGGEGGEGRRQRVVGVVGALLRTLSRPRVKEQTGSCQPACRKHLVASSFHKTSHLSSLFHRYAQSPAGCQVSAGRPCGVPPVAVGPQPAVHASELGDAGML